MKQKSKLKLHKEIKNDLKAIAEAFGEEAVQDQVQDELDRILTNPERYGKLCEYEPLVTAGVRKVKFFSNRQQQRIKGSKPDLRILYRYDARKDTVEIITIAQRVKVRPRPPEDAYSIAETRVSDDS